MRKIIEIEALSELFYGPFELIEDGFHEGQYNMDFDFGRTMAVSGGEELPLLRFYGWNPWTVSLGANQKESDVNIDLCSKKGFGLVRRPTGGRAVLHAHELTYSVVMKMTKSRTVHDVYRDIHVLLALGLKNLGCNNLDFEKTQPDLKNFYKDRSMSMSCFASSARYEVEYMGRKIIGSAQRLFGDVLLQHGSILLGPGNEQIAEVANFDTDEERTRLKNFILSHSSTAEEASGRVITYTEAFDAMLDAIQQQQ